MKEPARVNINNLGKNINSEYNEYGPVLHPSDSMLYFTSRRKHEENEKRWLGDKKFYSDIFYSVKKNGGWQKAKLVPKDLYSKDNDAVLEITTDPERIYIYLGDKDGGDIYYYEKKDKNKWKGPKEFSKLINTNHKESSMSITSDGRTVYFVSDIKEESLGGKDLFVSNLNNKDEWTYPKNLGGLVNSSLNEEGVYINPTEDKLYFSSEGHNSLGGYDIFYSERDVDGNWKEPVNLGYPVNTPYDDVLFTLIDENGKKAYYSSIHDDTYGKKDLYEIIFLGEEKELLTLEALEPISWNVKPNNDLLFSTPEKLAIDTTLYLVGNVMDSMVNKGINSKIQVIDNESNKVVSTFITDSLGEFVIRLPEKKKYGVEVTAKNYLFFADNINLNQMQINNDTIYHDFYLDKVEIGKKVVLENIYFETGSDKLKPESYPELERVVKLLKNNPSIKLEISGHTDNVGSYLANKNLSQARAKSVVDYLVDKGINKNRLKYKGYSFTQPIAPNDTPQGRQKNRRVEFKILEK
jgi:outer membrane protein OmpA-like peptidoglycan-associated protein